MLKYELFKDSRDMFLIQWAMFLYPMEQMLSGSIYNIIQYPITYLHTSEAE